MCKYFSFILLIVSASAVLAQNPPTTKVAPTQAEQSELERLEQLESYEKVMEVLRQAEASLDAMTRARKFSCLKAFGSEAFCECLNKNLAVGLDFDGYIAVITRTKEELKYDTLSKEDKGLVDNAVATRNACAK